jgi:hypothetical protein
MLQRRRNTRGRDPAIVALAGKLLEFLQFGSDIPWTLDPEDVLRLVHARLEATDMSYAPGEIFCQALLTRLALCDAAAHDFEASSSLAYLSRGARYGAIVQATVARLRRDAGY